MKSNLKYYLLILLALFWCILSYQNIDVQHLLSQGDHGRDLYAFERTMHGDKPYQDYWWVYGPIMPYYYSLFFKLLGVNIPSILFGKQVLILVGAIFTYLALCQFISPVLALLGGLWFLIFMPDFFFTYNHIGAIALMPGLILSLFLYIRTPRHFYLTAGLLCCALIALVKLNFGVVNLFCFALSVYLIDTFHGNKNKNGFYFRAFIVAPLIVLCIYMFFCWDLPGYYVRQCLPFSKSDHPYHMPLLAGFMYLIKGLCVNMSSSLINLIFAALIWLGFGNILHKLSQKETVSFSKKPVILSLMILSIFIIANSHEFVISGVDYRLFWPKPFQIILIFFILGFGLKNLSTLIKFIFYSALCLILINQNWGAYNFNKNNKHTFQYLGLEKAGVFVHNDPFWIDTVTQTSEFLKNNLKPDETFLALPYDPLYYYLTSKKAPVKELIFFEHINIPSEQEKNIINALEKNQVNWVVISSRMKTFEEEGMGEFGVTYCPLLGNYIFKNYTPVQQFGDWQSPPGWAWGHGTRIYLRKTISSPPAP